MNGQNPRPLGTGEVNGELLRDYGKRISEPSAEDQAHGEHVFRIHVDVLLSTEDYKKLKSMLDQTVIPMDEVRDLLKRRITGGSKGADVARDIVDVFDLNQK